MTDTTEAISIDYLRIPLECALETIDESDWTLKQFARHIRALLDRLDSTQALLDLVEDGKRNIEASLREEIAGITTRYNEVMSRLDSAERDQRRYQLLRRGQHWGVINGIGDTLRAGELDAAIDAALSVGPVGGEAL